MLSSIRVKLNLIFNTFCLVNNNCIGQFNYRFSAAWLKTLSQIVGVSTLHECTFYSKKLKVGNPELGQFKNKVQSMNSVGTSNH